MLVSTTTHCSTQKPYLESCLAGLDHSSNQLVLGQGIDHLRLGCDTNQHTEELGLGQILWGIYGLTNVGLLYQLVCAKGWEW